jgi:hypothetical protein
MLVYVVQFGGKRYGADDSKRYGEKAENLVKNKGVALWCVIVNFG